MHAKCILRNEHLDTNLYFINLMLIRDLKQEPAPNYSEHLCLIENENEFIRKTNRV